MMLVDQESLPETFFPIEEEPPPVYDPVDVAVARMLRISVEELIADREWDDIPWSWPL